MQRRRGHLLAEILVALGALIPAIALIFGLFPVAHRMEQQAWERWTAAEVAQQKMEWARQAELGAIPAQADEVVVRDGLRFHLRLTGQDLIPGRLKRIVVSVRGPGQAVELELRRSAP